MTATELKKRAIALAEKTKIDSVTPEEVGQLSNDIVEYIENVEINGSSLGIRKTYTSVSAMEADSTAPKDDKGVLLRRGMLVNIYNQSDQDSADNGKVFSFQNPGWAFRGTVDAGYATKEELTELGKELNFTNNSISLIIGDIENLEYTESECINENMSLNNKGQLTSVEGVKASDFKNIENAIYLSYNIQNKGGNYVIAFYSDESEDSYLGQYSSTNLPSAGIDTDITKYIPNGAKYIRYTTYSNWVLRIKVIKSILPSSGLLGNLSELKTEEKESFVSAFNELYDKNEEYNDKIENILNGGDYNYVYTEKDCIFLDKGLNSENGKEISYNNCILSGFLPIDGFNSIKWNQPYGKNDAYKICFYRNKNEDSFIKTFSSNELSEINTDEDITENSPSEAKYLRFTTYKDWNPVIKVYGTAKGLEEEVKDMTASNIYFKNTLTLEAENVQKAIEILSLRISSIGSTKKVIKRGINFIGHSIWANNNTQDNFADNQIIKGYQTRILERFEFTDGWRQHVVSGSHLRTDNFLANVAKLDAKENDIWTLDTFVNEGYNENGVGTYDDFLAHDMDSDVTTLTYMGALGRFAKIVEEKSGTGAIIIASDNLFDPQTAGDKLRHDNLAALIEVCKRQGWYFCSQMTLSGFNEYNYKFFTKNGGYVEGKYPVDTSIYEGDGVHPNNIGYSLAVRPWLQILEEIWFRDNQLVE